MSFTRSKSWVANRWLITALIFLAILYISTLCVYFWATQVSKILAPLGKISTDPGRMGMLFERVAISLRSGENNMRGKLDAYWVPVVRPDAPVFLYLHGQDATIGKKLDHTERFHDWGWNVLVIEYRGFGESFRDEEPNENKVFEDALAALKYLKNDRKFASKKIFIYGHSLGGAVAIELANQPESSDTAGVSALSLEQDMKIAARSARSSIASALVILWLNAWLMQNQARSLESPTTRSRMEAQLRRPSDCASSCCC